MSSRARCPQCDKVYRVPHLEREWRCKTCGGPLEPEAAVEEPGCPACGAPIDESASFCEECGAALRESALPRSRSEERVAGAQMRKAMKRVRMLRLFLYLALFGAVAQLLMTVVIAWSGEFEVAVVVVGLALTGVMTWLVLLALHNLERRPFPVALALTVLQTLEAATLFATEGAWIPAAVWSLFYWLITISAARVSRLARQYPDLYLSKKMRGASTHRSGGKRLRQIEAGRKRREKRKFVLYSVAIAALVVLGFAGLGRPESTSPAFDAPSPVEAIEEYADAWNRFDLDHLAVFAGDEHREKRRRSLASAMRKYEWGSELPMIETYDYDESHVHVTPAYVTFETEGGPLKATFSWDGDEWLVRAMDFKGVKHWRP